MTTTTPVLPDLPQLEVGIPNFRLGMSHDGYVPLKRALFWAQRAAGFSAEHSLKTAEALGVGDEWPWNLWVYLEVAKRLGAASQVMKQLLVWFGPPDVGLTPTPGYLVLQIPGELNCISCLTSLALPLIDLVILRPAEGVDLTLLNCDLPVMDILSSRRVTVDTCTIRHLNIRHLNTSKLTALALKSSTVSRLAVNSPCAVVVRDSLICELVAETSWSWAIEAAGRCAVVGHIVTHSTTVSVGDWLGGSLLMPGANAIPIVQNFDKVKLHLERPIESGAWGARAARQTMNTWREQGNPDLWRSMTQSMRDLVIGAVAFWRGEWLLDLVTGGLTETRSEEEEDDEDIGGYDSLDDL